MARRGKAWRLGRQLTAEERAEIVERYRAGELARRLAAAIGCSERTVYNVLEDAAFRESAAHSPSSGDSGLRLSFAERERISRGVAVGESARAIARALDRAPSTVSRELEANGGRRRYRALKAHRRARSCAARPKPTKLSSCPRLRRAVEAGLSRRWSPEQISARLRSDDPHDRGMRISHETIYRSLYVQSRGELRRQLARNLRTARTKRRPRRDGPERRGRIHGMVPISERPPEIEDRAVPGHWEGDLLVGARGRSFIATLVERQTRYVMLARLGSERTTEHVVEALKQRIGELPSHLVRSLTWDQGNELSSHARFRVETGVDVYFCDPHSPWQRGSNENTNGLLRQYLAKGSDLAARSQVELDEIAAELNGRPRKTLGWATPAEKMEELLR
jgi:IS30 family transposase